LRYDESLRLGEDYALYVQALIAGARYRLIRASGYVAVERSNSISSSHSAGDLERMAEFDNRCLAIHPSLPPAARSAFQAHRRSILRKDHHRLVLDCKGECGLMPALGKLVSFPTSVPYILAETTRAKIGMRSKVYRNDSPAHRSPKIRLL